MKLIWVILLLALVLRLPYLGSLPALYTDEASLGWNAWSILKTARDEYGALLPGSLRSFGDWKPPLSSYLMLPTIALFGLNEWGIRLPSLLLGIGTIGLVYILVAFGFGQKRWGLFAALILTITPWHIHESRMAMLVGVSLFFLTLGVTGWVLQGRSFLWRMLSVLGFVGAIYGYYGARLVVVLLGFFLLFSMRRQWRGEFLRAWIIPGFLGVLLIIPLFVAFTKNHEVLFGRARHVSVFADRGVELEIWDNTTDDGNLTRPEVARFWHNKLFAYTADILRRFGEHLDGRFLFLHGTRTEPFELPRSGEFLLMTFPFVLFGIIRLVHDRPLGSGVVLAWGMIAILPAALTFMTPASNRSFFLVVPLSIAGGYGMEVFFKRAKQYRVFGWSVLVILFAANVVFFLYQYYHRLPLELADKYRYGMRELVADVSAHKEHYDTVVISPASAHYIYFLVFEREHPDEYRKTVRLNETLDQFGFEHVDGYGKYAFRRAFAWKDEPKHQRILFVAADHEVPGDVPIGYNVRQTIYYPNGTPAYRIFDL